MHLKPTVSYLTEDIIALWISLFDLCNRAKVYSLTVIKPQPKISLNISLLMKIALQHLELKSKEMICIHVFTKLKPSCI